MNNNTELIYNYNQISEFYLKYPLSFIYMNIRSLRKNFSTFLANINKIIDSIELIILVETNIADDENDLFNINDFNGTFLNREGIGGGIAIYVKRNLKYITMNLTTQYYESIRLDISIGNKELSILSIYRPPSKNTRLFIDELEHSIKEIHKNQALIIIGDMNINIAAEINKTTRSYLDMMSAYGLECMVTNITREEVNKNKGTCIDHLFIRKTKSIPSASASVILTTISDHYSLFGCMGVDNNQFISSECTAKGNASISKEPSKFFSVNSKKVNDLIKKTDWRNIINQNESCNAKFESMYLKFKEIYSNSTQMSKKIKKRNNYPWLSDQILKCCDMKDKLYQRHRKNRNNLEKEREYKSFNNKLNQMINNAKNEYRMKEFIKNRKNMRGTWSLINEIIGKKTHNVDEVIKRNFKNIDLKIVTEEFAIQFKANVQNILHDCDIKTNFSQVIRAQNTIFMEQTNETEILNIIKNINSNKGAGFDGIRPVDIRKNAEIFAPIITNIVNSSLNENVIPNMFKTALVRPIYKNGNKTDYNNYRPISILPVIEKVLEEIVVRRMNDFLCRYKIISKQQYGFQKGRNINQLLGHFSSYINKCLDTKMHCLVLFVDFSKAFDTLSHAKLLDVLERVGIRGNCLEWIKNYLYCRKYRVKIDEHLSQEKDLHYGVPQGSKLGPILYLIYANEMIRQANCSKIFAYADDTAIIVAHNDLERAVENMQNELYNITKWCHDNGLIINANKTKLMHIKQPHIPTCDINIKFHNNDCLHKKQLSTTFANDTCDKIIEVVGTYKYLGVMVDHNFNWKEHILNLNKKLRKVSYVLYHLNNCAPIHVTKQAYYSLAESYIRHGITAYGNSSHCNTLQKSQDRLIKILMKNKSANSPRNHLQYASTLTQRYTSVRQNQINYNTPEETIKEFMKIQNIMTIKNIYKTTIIKEFEDANFLEPISHSHNTRRRAEGRFKTPRFNNKYGKNSIEVQLPSILNALPMEIFSLQNKIKRRKNIKQFFLNSQ